ncbi:CoA transferase [Sphaerimonospora mesophila]|uniref:CaiB/BaiF CoA transferase family protein n=1 Tax=Sphaerimonospora mesophila TaxID=37483 RepID=UPI0006E17A40
MSSNGSQTALQGVRVLELGGSGYAVPYAGRLLADLGAEVILIEPVGGHPLRSSGGSFADDPVVARRTFSFLSGGKRSVVVDLDSPEAAVIMRRLIASCDVVIESLGTDTLRVLGVEDDDVSGLERAPVLVHVSPWGDTGPYRDLPATPLVLQAAAGWVTTRQEPGLPLVQVGGQMYDWIAGSFIAAAVMTARAWTRRNGTGATIDFSLFECIHATIPYTRLMTDTNRELGLAGTGPAWTPFGIRPCKDGWVGINILTGQQWVDACLLTDLADFTDKQQELVRGEGDLASFERRLLDWLSDRTVNEVVDLGQSLRIPVVPVAAGGRATSLPQWVERPFFSELDDDGEPFTIPGPPWRLNRTPAVTRRPVGEAGEATGAVLDELGLTGVERAR